MMRRRLSASGRRAIASASASSGLRADARHDVVVVGGGVMGVWTAIALAKRGASVCLAEQFAPAHEKGSSHGDGRIYRLAYTEDIYVDMMRQSLPMWHDLQDFAQTPLLHETGGLNIAPVDSGLLDEQGALYARRGIAHEWLSAGEVNARFPQYGLPTSGPRQMRALFQPDFGVLFASKCVAAAWEYAAHLGVETVTGFRATALHDEGGESGGLVVADANGRAIRASAVVLAAGPWLTSLASALLGAGAPAIPTVVSAETVCFYAPKRGMEAAHSYEAMPVFIPEFDNGLGPFGYYGLPMIDVPGIKCSAHYCGPLVDPDRRPAAAGGDAAAAPAAAAEEAAAAARVAAVVDSTSRCVAETFPHVDHTPFTTSSCLYTTTPDHDYILSRAPTHFAGGRVILAGGGSGHAFKMGPAIGEAAASLALPGVPPPFDLQRFDVRRLLQLRGADLDHEARAERR